jgi:hypothetical protein
MATNPLDIVHNPSTQSSAHDAQKAKEHAEAEARRAKLDQMRATADRTKRERVVGDTAKLGTHSLMGDHAKVVIKLVHKDKSTISFETCELSHDADGLTLIVACPSCIFRFNKRMEDSQLTLRSWHRKFTLDQTHFGKLWVNPANPSEALTLPGAIETEDVQTCPVCHFRFHIEPSKDPKEQGVSILREA